MGKLTGLLLLLLSSTAWGDVTVNPAPVNTANFINNQQTAQSATLNVSSGTIANFFAHTVTTNGLGSIFSDNATTLDPTSVLDVYKNNAAGAGGDILFSVGSNQQASQFVVADQQPLSLVRYGSNIGGLQIGLVATPYTVYANQSSQNHINLWNVGEVEIKSATSGNGGKDITLYPQQVEAIRVTSTVVRCSVPVRLFSRTIAQLKTIIPGAVGEEYYCSDCTVTGNVSSTGTVVGSFSGAASKTTVVQ